MKQFIKDSITLVLGHNVLSGHVRRTGISTPAYGLGIGLDQTSYPIGVSFLFTLLNNVAKIFVVNCDLVLQNLEQNICSDSIPKPVMWALFSEIGFTKILM